MSQLGFGEAQVCMSQHLSVSKKAHQIIELPIVELLESAAESGVVSAMNALGNHLLCGRGCEKDTEVALKYFGFIDL